METKLFDSGKMSVGGNRSRTIVSKTPKGIVVKCDSLYSDYKATTQFFADGNYPELPSDWQSIVNTKYMTTAADVWFHDLEGYTANRVTH